MATSQPPEILVVGHDPRLQNSQAEAETALFFDYLTRPEPAQPSERAKYGLARGTWEYVNQLAGNTLPLEQLWVTNLCNVFLPRPGKGTLLIPREVAEQGVEAIKQTVATGQFRAILPMSEQVCYWLCELGFIDQQADDRVVRYRREARPRPGKAAQGFYTSVGRAPFLGVCGQKFTHGGVPVIPILHTKQWPLKTRTIRYTRPMEQAGANLRAMLAAQTSPPNS